MPVPTKLTPALQRAMLTLSQLGYPCRQRRRWLASTIPPSRIGSSGASGHAGAGRRALYVSFASSIVRAQAEDGVFRPTPQKGKFQQYAPLMARITFV